MKPHLYSRNLPRPLWDCASTSYSSVDQLPPLVKSKQPHWWQFRAAEWLKVSSRFARTRLNTQQASGQRELSGSGLAGPGPGVPGRQAQLKVPEGHWCFCVPLLCSMMGWHRGSVCVDFCTMSCSWSCKPSVFSDLWALNQTASYLL